MPSRSIAGVISGAASAVSPLSWAAAGGPTKRDLSRLARGVRNCSPSSEP
jgi:hypothetical protein